jgi:hypothetical protein
VTPTPCSSSLPAPPPTEPRRAYPELVQTDELWGEDEPEQPARYVDGAWGRTANPNTADGELQNIAAFGTGLTRLKGPRRTAAMVVVWLILLGFAITIGYGIVGIVSIW